MGGSTAVTLVLGGTRGGMRGGAVFSVLEPIATRGREGIGG